MMRRAISSQALVYEELVRVAEERVREKDLGLKGDEHTITFAIHDLCLHPEFVEPLRRELQSSEYAAFGQTASGLPLLDSFIKESARLTPAESMSTRRQAMKNFALSDGTQIKAGDWTCTPVSAMIQTADLFPSPLTFNGFRFVDPALLDRHAAAINETMQPEPSKLTDMNTWRFMSGVRAAMHVMKVFLAQIILDYDVRLVNPGKRRTWTWRSFTLPLEKTVVQFKPLKNREKRVHWT
ncbi:MAG: hypothetical protein Q9160_007538 [Pyrenula sp. 1 TL-2023]